MASADDQRLIGSSVDEDAPPKMPSWVKYLLLGLAAAVILAVLAMLVVGGEHGPGRHASPHSASTGMTDSPAWH